MLNLRVQALAHCETRFDVKFVRYAQSSKCKTEKDSSVSYASAVVRVSEAKGKKRKERKEEA